MMHSQKLEHRFVRHFPELLEPGVLYVSVEFATASHSCCCGCGEEVVTPFSPAGWQMVFDGETVSLWPSVGNWSLPCRSHYFIERGNVVEASPWSDEQVAAGRRRDKAAREQHYGVPAVVGPPAQPPPAAAPVPPATQGEAPNWWSWLWSWFFPPRQQGPGGS